MNTEEKARYFQELTLNLQHKGFTVKQGAEEGILTVELDGRRLCSAVDTGVIRYHKKDAEGDIRNAALNRVTDIARATAEYMSRIEAAPQLGIGPKGDYRLLADFNDVVLAGHPTEYGVEFITWERVQEGTALHQGDYYGPGAGADSYAAAKYDRLDCVQIIKSYLSETEDLIAEKDLQIHLDIPPAAFINGNKMLMEKVFSNLIGNAIKYSPYGASICISTYIEQGQLWSP